MAGYFCGSMASASRPQGKRRALFDATVSDSTRWREGDTYSPPTSTSTIPCGRKRYRLNCRDLAPRPRMLAALIDAP